MMLTATLVTALLLRIAVPQGLMPADDGWFLKICPDGLPAKVAAIFGDEHAHHHGHENSETYSQCDLSGFGSGDLALWTGSIAGQERDVAQQAVVTLASAYFFATWNNQRARAPPKTSQLT